jgi:hypothetical protein
MTEGPRKKSSFSKRGFRPSVFEESLVKEGTLHKLSSGVLKRYQKRYFTLEGRSIVHILYFFAYMWSTHLPSSFTKGTT